jgi:hypothetical protein
LIINENDLKIKGKKCVKNAEFRPFSVSNPPFSPSRGGIKLPPAMPPPTCQLAIPAQAGANLPHLSQQTVSVCTSQCAAQSKSSFFLGHDFKACPERSRIGAENAAKQTWALAPDGSLVQTDPLLNIHLPPKHRLCC